MGKKILRIIIHIITIALILIEERRRTLVTLVMS